MRGSHRLTLLDLRTCRFITLLEIMVRLSVNMRIFITQSLKKLEVYVEFSITECILEKAFTLQYKVSEGGCVQFLS